MGDEFIFEGDTNFNLLIAQHFCEDKNSITQINVLNLPNDRYANSAEIVLC